MELNELYALLEGYAPVSLSDEYCKIYGAYDNSGIIINCDREIKGVLFSLDFSMKAVLEACDRGFNAIVTHHPAIFGGVKRLDLTTSPQAAAIADCFRRGISVISMHLNLDVATNGIDHFLMCGLGGNDPLIMEPVAGSGYGRVYDIAPIAFTDICEKVRRNFATSRALFYGDRTKRIERVASFCGAGTGEKSIAFAAENGADLFVSSDMKHHEIAELLSMGKNVIVLTHYASEYYGFNKISRKIMEKLKVPAAVFCDVGLM